LQGFDTRQEAAESSNLREDRARRRGRSGVSGDFEFATAFNR
jgi:hypothetical protein